MPLYTYQCDHCGVQFDRRQNFEDPPLNICPECGKKSLRKLFTPVGILFKGSGFYATDHRSPSGQSPAKKQDESKTNDETKSSAGTTPSADSKASKND
jgi:putative FmdB family regulatory protein